MASRLSFGSSGRVVKNVLDNNGDLSIVQSKKISTAGFWNYAEHFSYTAAGAVSSMQLGNGKWESTQFNPRLQPTQIALGTVQNGTDNLKLNYTYNSSGQNDNNGNVLSQTITVPTVGQTQGFTATQNYTYDSLNRLKSAQESIGGGQTWKQTFLYDRYGNRNFDTANTTTLGTCPANQCNPTVDTTNNRFTTGQGYTYDFSGNVKTDAEGRSFSFDGENKQTKVTSGGQTVGEYFYDGDGKRVKKYVPSTGETTIFVYDASGKMVAEYSTVVATPTEAKVSYLTNDHLGSPRITTDANGAVTSRRDFMPFGEEVARTGYGTDSVRQKFTAYERDIESGFDFAQARYHSYTHGRFTSPDEPFADHWEDNLQTWNLYVYARNNPLNFVDPLGTRAEKPDDNEVIRINCPCEDSKKWKCNGTPINFPSVTLRENNSNNGHETIGKSYNVTGNQKNTGSCIIRCMNDNRVDKIAKSVGESTGIPHAGFFLQGLTWIGTGAAIGNQTLNSTSLGKYPRSPLGGLKTKGTPTSWQHRVFGIEIGGILRQTGFKNAARLSGLVVPYKQPIELYQLDDRNGTWLAEWTIG